MTTPDTCPEPLFRCEHATVTVRQRQQSNGVMVAVRQCERCGANLGCVKLATLTVPLASLPWWDEKRRETFADLERTRWAEERRGRDEEWWRRYEEHLQSEKWRQLRLKVLARCRGICEGCGERQAAHVHHLTYRRLGHEMLFDLVAVCLVCHQDIHPHRAIDPDVCSHLIEEARQEQEDDGWTPFG